jgi:DNA-directed RNA polymerase subunit RPC12/RpoP
MKRQIRNRGKQIQRVLTEEDLKIRRLERELSEAHSNARTAQEQVHPVPSMPTGPTSSLGTTSSFLTCSTCGDLVAQHHAVIECPKCVAKLTKKLLQKEEFKRDKNLKSLMEVCEAKTQVMEEQRRERKGPPGIRDWKKLRKRMGV